MSLPSFQGYQGEELILQRAGLMPNTPATLALRRMGEAIDILRGRRFAEEERRMWEAHYSVHGRHPENPSIQTAVTQVVARAMEDDGQTSSGAA